MRRTLVLTLLSVIALIAFSAVPAMLSDPATAGLSASATLSLNGSKSNIYRVKPKGEMPKGKMREHSCCGHEHGDTTTCCHSDPN